MTHPIHIVFTTIYHPSVMEDLYDNIARNGHLSDVKIWVVGDKKTPGSCADLVQSIKDKGLESVYLDVEQQDRWGRRCKDFYIRIPYNNETRRNIGYLHALEDGCQTLISIDDDNFPTDDDLVGFHKNTGKHWNGLMINEESGFHNICEYLSTKPDRQIFPRGFPFRLRGFPNQNIRKKGSGNPKIGVTAGLWLSDPDVDATTWLNGKIKGISYLGEDVHVLDHSTWSPVNTQNTSVTRELIPAYLCVPMGWSVPGGSIQRYGDIWGGYFLQALMKNTDFHIAFGRPIVDHRRNPHDYVDDLRYEYWGMILTDWLLEKLRTGFQPQSARIVDRVDELALFIQDQAIPELPNWCPEEIRDFLHWTEGNLRTWAEACRIVGC
jgi:reversibly glycosylated polypeptide